jgi:hypothetical protein
MDIQQRKLQSLMKYRRYECELDDEEIDEFDPRQIFNTDKL